MPRVHWAVRCHVIRKNSDQCQAWAIRGGRVCMAHGGALRRTRQEAIVRLTEKVVRREFAAKWADYEERLLRWQVDRVLVTSNLLGVPIPDVDWIHMAECRLRYGVPPSLDEAPKFRSGVDGRVRPFFRLGSADPRKRHADAAR